MVLRAETIDAIGAEAPKAYSEGWIGPVGLGEMNVLREWTVACEDVGAYYHVQLPVSGRFRLLYRGADLLSSPRVSPVGQPDQGPFVGTWGAGYRALCVSMERSAVDAALARLLGERVPRRVVFQPAMDLASSAGRAWAGFLLSVQRQMGTPGGLLSQPMVAAPLAEALINGFLLAAPHSYSEAVRDPVPAAAPAAVRAAVNLIEADPRAPLTVSGLAAHSGVSVRTLQNGFRRHFGMPPLAYLREVRLRRAHEDLAAADPFAVSVADVARRWGFGHLGRFAAAHTAKYGQTPLRTLRG